MTDRLEEIRQRAEAATPGPWVAFGHFSTDEQVTIMADTDGGEYVAIWDRPWAIGGHDERSVRDDATFIAHARQDIPYLLAQVEWLRAALDTEKEANVTGWRMVEAKTAQIEQLTADLADAHEECDRLMDLYLARRREHNKAAAEVERLRDALEGES